MFEPFIYHFQVFLLVLLRIFGIFIVTPFFGAVNIPWRIRGKVALILSIAMFPALSKILPIKYPESLLEYALWATGELLIGMTIGFIVTMIFSILQISGIFYSFQMGFGVSEIFDPMAQVQIPVLSQFLTLLTLLMFLVTNSHHMVIGAIYKSFELVPMIHLDAAGVLTQHITEVFAKMFWIALKIAMPLIGIMFLIYVALGILGKAAPQMNIMMFGWPITIVVGLLSLIIIMPLIMNVLTVVFTETFEDINTLLHALKRFK